MQVHHPGSGGYQGGPGGFQMPLGAPMQQMQHDGSGHPKGGMGSAHHVPQQQQQQLEQGKG